MADTPSGAEKRKRSKSREGTRKVPTKKLKEDPEIEKALRTKNFLRSMGVAVEYQNMIGRPLSDLTAAEKKKLASISLDKWLIVGAEDISVEVVRFWLARRAPLYISDRATATAPAWVARDKTWYTLWWLNSPFTMPGEHCRLGTSPEEQIAGHWVSNTFRPGRVGTPRNVVCEVLLGWRMEPNTLLHMVRTNLFGLLWLFEQLGADPKKLLVKIRFKDRRVAAATPGSKRNLPPDLKVYEDSMTDYVQGCLAEYKKFLDGADGYGYRQYMTAAEAADLANRDRMVRLWYVHSTAAACDDLWINDRRAIGAMKYHMLRSFGRSWGGADGSYALDKDIKSWFYPSSTSSP